MKALDWKPDQSDNLGLETETHDNPIHAAAGKKKATITAHKRTQP